jgi:transposase
MGNLRKIKKHVRSAGQPQTPPVAPAAPQRLELEMSELEAILGRAKASLTPEEYDKLHGALETLLFLTQELEKSRVSVQRLKQLLFGTSTEKTRKVLQQALAEAGVDSERDGDEDEASEATPPPEKRKGHGRHGAVAYTGGQQVAVKHPSLQGGDLCPHCQKGKVYETAEPSRLVRIRGQAPLGATVYELQRLRCNLCGMVFTAPAPPEVGEQKYDAESAAMIALLKYGSGLPFNRLERLERSLGIPLPATTQWEIVQASAAGLAPVWAALIRQAAQGQVLHNDDTTMKILGLAGNSPEPATEEPGAVPGRKGVFTSGIISVLEDHRIALFFTGHPHAGENLAAVLRQRAAELAPPIQMCDALSRNLPEELQTLLANCLAHGRRRFVEVAGNFPRECLYVLEVLQEVYRHEAQAKDQGLSAEERLRWHQLHSGPKMADLHDWLTAQLEQHRVEPNSGLGEAITYMLKHWKALTLFLRQPGAPLDNNVCEQALKKAILHRKNAYFYKTENGARVGDLFMSLIHTCELNGVNPFDYLTALQKHTPALPSDPDHWMPWNYRHALQMTNIS